MILHLGLCLLVVVNLLFVHITGVVDPAWVLLFAALTLLAPLLRRFTDTLLHRLMWNGVVLVLFASLVQRTLSQGVARMLEGGLVLAAFCQVHLVNNVSAKQRPDLLLFNSFLIAVITAFFCQELAYCFVFVGYAFALLTVWRLLAHGDAHGTATLPVVMRDGARQAVCVLAATVAVFVFWPRDFDRPGLVGDHLMQAAQAQVGIADQIRLSHRLSPVQSDRVAMRIHGRGEIPTHWRGTTFRLLRRGAWDATTSVQEADGAESGAQEHGLDRKWLEAGRGRWTRERSGEGAPQGRLRVEVLDLTHSRLFLPADAAAMQLTRESAEVPHLPLADGTFGYFAAESGVAADKVTYDVTLSSVPPRQVSPRRRLDGWLGLDLSAVPTEALQLAQEVRAGLPADAPAAAVAAAMCERVRAEFEYGLPGLAGSASDLHEFFRLRRGHCEFFASALAMMLRSQRIACRLVGGFLAVEREDEDTVVVRARHAHAWVEAWDSAAGWCTFDPTPPQTENAQRDSWLGRLLDSAEAAWNAITGFDERRRVQAWLWAAGLPARAAAAIAEHAWASVTVLGLLVWFWRARRRHGRPAVVEYERALRRARLRLAPGETPRQLLARARKAQLLPVDALRELVAATERHERLRYRGAGAVAPAR